MKNQISLIKITSDPKKDRILMIRFLIILIIFIVLIFYFFE